VADVADVAAVRLRAETPGRCLHDGFARLDAARPQHDQGGRVRREISVLPDAAACKNRNLVLLSDLHEVQIRVAHNPRNRMPHVVHRDVIGRPRAAILAVHGQGRGVWVSGQVVEDRQGGGGGRDLRIDRDAEAPGHRHRLDHLGDRLLDGVLCLMRGRTG